MIFNDLPNYINQYKSSTTSMIFNHPIDDFQRPHLDCISNWCRSWSLLATGVVPLYDPGAHLATKWDLKSSFRVTFADSQHQGIAGIHSEPSGCFWMVHLPPSAQRGPHHTSLFTAAATPKHSALAWSQSGFDKFNAYPNAKLFKHVGNNVSMWS